MHFRWLLQFTLYVGRTYQTYDSAGWLGTVRAPLFLVYVIPRGAVFSEATRAAYGGYVGMIRAVPTQVLWTGMCMWTPVIVFVGGMFHPTTVLGCQVLYSCMGLVLVCMGISVIAWAPLRSDTGGVLHGASRIVLGGVMFAMAGALVNNNAAKDAASTAVFVLSIVLMVVVVCGAVHDRMLVRGLADGLRGRPAYHRVDTHPAGWGRAALLERRRWSSRVTNCNR